MRGRANSPTVRGRSPPSCSEREALAAPYASPFVRAGVHAEPGPNRHRIVSSFGRRSASKRRLRASVLAASPERVRRMRIDPGAAECMTQAPSQAG